MWTPNGDTPGLALSRAIGDHCVKEFGLISVPDVTQRTITNNDQFVILATDGVCKLYSVPCSPRKQGIHERVSPIDHKQKSYLTFFFY